MNEITKRIKEIRISQNLTQEKFANKLKTSRANIAGYEAGTRIPSEAALNNICREFNVSEEWLRHGTGEMFIEQTRDEQIATFVGRLQANESDSFKKRFISMLSALDESEWEVLEKMVLMLHNEKKD